MFTVTVLTILLGFGLMQWSMNQLLRQMDRQRARQEEVWHQQQEVWQRLLVKAENTERLTQEILTRLAPGMWCGESQSEPCTNT
jgi:hypothetical protein